MGFLPFLNPQKPQETLFELSRKYGKVFGLQLGSIYAVVLADVGIIRETLRRDEFSGRAPLNVTFGIFNGFGEVLETERGFLNAVVWFLIKIVSKSLKFESIIDFLWF